MMRYVNRATLGMTLLFLSSFSYASNNPRQSSTELSRKLFYEGLYTRLVSNIDTTQYLGTTEEIDYGRLAFVGGTMAVGMAGIHIYQQNGWWKDNRAPFHFREDLTYGLGVDKIGHFYGASVLTFVISRAVGWAHVSEPGTLWIGAGASLLFQTYIEVEDGFSAWGFDRVDFAADAAGAFWPVAQHYVPWLQQVHLKMSYRPSDLINNPGGAGFRGQKHLMMDDYEGQTFWLSSDLDNLAPVSLQNVLPDFLGIALGYGARDIATAGSAPYRVYFLALDYDFTKIIPQNTWFLKTLSETLNFIHFPSAAIRISPSVIWYGLYF